MNYTRDLVVSAFTLLPYFVLALIIAAFADKDEKAWTFLVALLVLLALRTFIVLMNTVSGILQWRLCGRKREVAHAFTWFASWQFPQRKYADDDLGNYLARIEHDAEQPLAVRLAATELNNKFLIYESFGILVGARFRKAYEIALEQYAPRSRAAKASVFDEPWFTKTREAGQDDS